MAKFVKLRDSYDHGNGDPRYCYVNPGYVALLTEQRNDYQDYETVQIYGPAGFLWNVRGPIDEVAKKLGIAIITV